MSKADQATQAPGPPVAVTAPAQSLRERIGSELIRIIRAYVVLSAVMLAVISLLFGYYYKFTEIRHKQALITTRLGAEVANVAHELDSLRTSSLLWTGLSDSHGRDTYLMPLLARFNRSESRQFSVLDYQGRMVVASEASSTDALPAHEAVQRAVESGASAHGSLVGPAGSLQLVLVQPVLSPLSMSPVGFIVATVNPYAAIHDLNLNPSVKVSFSPGRATSGPAGALMAYAEGIQVLVGSDDFRVPVRIQLSQYYLSSVMFALVVIVTAFLLGLITIRRVSQWAKIFSASTTDRLDQLVAYCQSILAGREPPVLPETHHDEISSVLAALGKMLSQQKEITDALRTTSLVFETAAEAILVTNPAGEIVEVNPALERMTGYTRAELIGHLAGTLYRRNDTALDTEGSPSLQPYEISAYLEAHGHWHGDTFFVSKDGRQIATAISISRILDEAGHSMGQVAVVSDISQLKEAERKLRVLAYRDALTELPNLRMLTELVQKRLRLPDAATRPFAVLFIDLDHLKAVNDNYGHEIGDVMIKSVAVHLRNRLPPGHLLCRRSGDEFIAIVDLLPGESAVQLGARFLSLAAHEFPTEAGILSASATIGLARFPADAKTWAEVLICADVAMNEAKKASRGSVACYNAKLGQKLYRKRLIQGKLAHAIEHKLVQVHYQPEVDLHTGQIIGFEALARWTDAELGPVRPAEFVPIAEEAHLSERLAILVLENILRDKPQIQGRFPHAVVAFNAEPQVFRSSRLLNYLSDCAAEDQDCLSGLELELTESDIASGGANLLQQLQMLTGIGVELVIDDFGKGYSSLSRLAEFPISRLKIDGTFVAKLGHARQGKIVELIINLADVLGLAVTAEGVETQAQRASLLGLGCKRGQGWLYAKAQTLAQVMQLPQCMEALEPTELAEVSLKTGNPTVSADLLY